MNSRKTIQAPSRRAATLFVLAMVLALPGCKIFGGKDGPKTPTVGERIPILSRIESGAQVDPMLEGVSVILPPPTVNEEWAQAGGNAGKSYGHLALSASPTRIWTAQVEGSSNKRRLAASPVVGEGKLFVMDTAGMVTAFDAGTGARLWSKDMGVSGDGSSSVFGGGASYDNGRVYVTNGIGQVAALEASDGSEIWKVKPSGPLRGSPTVAFNSVYVMSQDNQIFALNAADGSALWTESASMEQAGVFGVAAPAAGQGTVIAGYSSGELVAYRYENGRQLWSDALARTSISTEVGSLSDVDADPIIDRGRVYALGQGGRMAAYELVSGQRIWELNLAGISTPIVAGDWVFTLTDHAQFLAIQRGSGKVRWLNELAEYRKPKKKKDRIFWVGPVLAGGRLWVANSQGLVASADPANGTMTNFTELNDPVSLAPVVANETLYILDDGGRISAYR
ncbi:pyrrolo-quinoline quinone [Novosphingobium sp. PC22D]|uniref:outer membrane protein assembly factor BamB family protein n=1 Tax=Novosphingobium sp. PC22D TaxID=1962403 RepID=UPI000BF0759E|nr:PQQ-like beta-propeller repeat protein [Novosphingobium sp. PC22D]PEQ13114.1 pyrrolo-quinoline quinone [Novosphingobium sp. PC22D]